MSLRWQIRLLLLSLMTSGFASAEDGDANNISPLATYRSTVSEVRVTFFANNENNQAIDTIAISDFAIVDNERVVRNFKSFVHSDETSLEVIALVDMSESVAPNFKTAIKNVLQLINQEQAIADDSISVVSFGGTFFRSSGKTSSALHPIVLCSSGCRTSDSVSHLLEATSSGTTPLFDSLIFSSDFVSQHHHVGARPVLILFSDGNDTSSLHSARDALQSVMMTGALIYSVDMGEKDSFSAGSMFLRQVSEATGGRYFSPRAVSGGAAAVLKAVLEDLRDSFVVTYDLPSHEPGFHALRLLPTHNLKLTFHSRSGYYYDPGLHTED